MKKAFTLVEILVAVVLLGLISIFISSTIMQTKKNNEVFKQQTLKDVRLHVMRDTLYKDIFEGKDLSIKGGKKYTILHVKSKNSIYGMSEPYVVWLVLKEDNSLVRLESAKKIVLPLRDDLQNGVFLDVLAKGCENFSVNISRDKKKVLSFIEVNNQMPTLFEIVLL